MYMASDAIKIVECQARDDYKLWIRFNDGVMGEVSVKHLVGMGVFAAWNSVEFFKSLYIDPIAETVAWGEDLDLDPYVLHERLISSRN
jgi:hypothetical protein